MRNTVNGKQNRRRRKIEIKDLKAGHEAYSCDIQGGSRMREGVKMLMKRITGSGQGRAVCGAF